MLAEKTIEEFVAENDISLAYTKALNNPPMNDDMFHYNCTLTIGNRSLMIPYSKGAGLVRLKAKPDGLRMPAGVTANDIKKSEKHIRILRLQG